MNLQLQFRLGSYFGIPQIKVALDDYMLLYSGPAQTLMQFDVPLDDGHHELKIVHHGKTVHDHLLDDQGLIVQDKFVEIEKIWMDNVQLDQELWSGRFFPVYMHKADNEPYSICPNLYLGHNGTWILNFNTPALTWLIASRKPGPNLDGTIFKTSRETLHEVKQIFLNLPDV